MCLPCVCHVSAMCLPGVCHVSATCLPCVCVCVCAVCFPRVCHMLAMRMPLVRHMRAMCTTDVWHTCGMRLAYMCCSGSACVPSVCPIDATCVCHMYVYAACCAAMVTWLFTGIVISTAVVGLLRCALTFVQVLYHALAKHMCCHSVLQITTVDLQPE